MNSRNHGIIPITSDVLTFTFISWLFFHSEINVVSDVLISAGELLTEIQQYPKSSFSLISIT